METEHHLCLFYHFDELRSDGGSLLGDPFFSGSEEVVAA